MSLELSPQLTNCGARQSRDELVDLLYRKHHHDLVRYLAGKFGRTGFDLEDVVQATFMKVADHQDLGRIDNYRAYIFSVASNIAIDHWRKNARWGTVERELHVLASTAPTSSVSAERILIDRERLSCIETALKKMPKQRRRVFLMVRIEGLSVQDVATHFAMSEAAVYKHVARALADCSKMLQTFEERTGC